MSSQQHISTNTKKRLLGDLRLLLKEKPEFIEAMPKEDNMLIWYFILKGPEDTCYKGGYYIGRIEHHINYPLKPPKFFLMTPNGRFAADKEICLTISRFHEDQWAASWTILNILNAFLSVMVTDQDSGISHIIDSTENRIKFAEQSVEYNKKHYMDILKRFKRLVDENGNPV